MKQVLVLTDYSANAAHAAVTAVRLCEKLNADLLLYHTVQYIAPTPGFNGGPYITETSDILFSDSRAQLNKEADTLKSLALEMTGYQPEISAVSGEGNLGDNIKLLSGQAGIQLVVMGGRSGGRLDHLLTGSETAAIIDSAGKPVLIIPEKTDLQALKKAVFATDFGIADIPALNYLLEMARLLHFHLEVVHIVQPGEVNTDIQPELAFRKYLAGCKNEEVSYKQLFGSEAAQQLHYHCHDTGAGLLAMTHGHHGFLSRLFGHSETKAVIAHQDLAVLIFPTGFNEL